MTWTDGLLRLRALFRRSDMDEDLEEELQFHLEMQARKNQARELSPTEARRQARLQFGSIERATEECREARGTGLADNLSRDFRYAIRMLRKSPGFAAVAILTLALGIGASTSIFSVIENVLLEPFPYRDARRFMTVEIRDAAKAQASGRAEYSGPEFLEYARRNHVFGRVIANASEEVLYRQTNGAERLHGVIVTPGTFEFFGMPPLLGRVLVPADYKRGAPPVFVLRNKTWLASFGGDPTILNKTFELNGVRRTLVGIMPPRFAWGDGDVWLPESPSLSDSAGNGDFPRDWYLVGHLKPRVSIREAQADLTAVANQLAKIYPKRYPEHFVVTLVSFTDMVVGRFRSTLYVTLAAVALLLLIACANVANLILARSTAREREFAIRAALGGQRSVLVRQMLIESLVLALISAAVGAGFAAAGLRWIVFLIPPATIAAETQIRMNPPVLLFAIFMAVLTPVLFGFAPALGTIRSDLEKPLRSSSKGMSSTTPTRWADALIVSEIALSFTLLISAGLLMRSFFALRSLDLGFDPHNVLVTRIPLPADHYKTASQIAAFYQPLLNSIRTLPGVVAAAESSAIPPDGSFLSEVDVAGQVHTERWTSRVQLSSEDYFSVLHMKLLQGRTFTQAETNNARKVAVVNESFEKSYLGPDAIGRSVHIPGLESFPDPVPNPSFRVIGVVQDAVNQGLQEPVRPEIWVPYSVTGFGERGLLIRTTGDPGSLVNAVRNAVWASDRGVPLTLAASLDERLESFWYAGPRFGFVLMSIFAAVGLTLASVGVYSVTAYSVSRRTHEIGIRMSLGARRTDALRLIFTTGMRLILLGVFLGLIFSFVLSRLVAGQLWSTSQTDPVTLASVGALLLCIGGAACLIPALRATRVDPVVALRHE